MEKEELAANKLHGPGRFIDETKVSLMAFCTSRGFCNDLAVAHVLGALFFSGVPYFL